MFVFDECRPYSQLEIKLLYCMKQCCQNSPDKKFRCGQHCIKKLIEEVMDIDDFSQLIDFAFNSVALLLVL